MLELLLLALLKIATLISPGQPPVTNPIQAQGSSLQTDTSTPPTPPTNSTTQPPTYSGGGSWGEGRP